MILYRLLNADSEFWIGTESSMFQRGLAELKISKKLLTFKVGKFIIIYCSEKDNDSLMIDSGRRVDAESGYSSIRKREMNI